VSAIDKTLQMMFFYFLLLYFLTDGLVFNDSGLLLPISFHRYTMCPILNNT
jgi:hypothetical protein